MENKPYIFPDGRMKPKDAAIYTGFNEGSLANWRVTGKGPRFTKIGNRIFYYQSELDSWMTQGSHFTTTAQASFTSAV